MSTCDECGLPIEECNAAALDRLEAERTERIERQRQVIVKLKALLRRADDVIVWDMHMPDGREFQNEIDDVLGLTSPRP